MLICDITFKHINAIASGDFGISKMMEATLDVASTCVGTPCYLAPEMCQDIPYSSKADVWVRQKYISDHTIFL